MTDAPLPPLNRSDLEPDPVAQFDRWFAQVPDVPNREACTLATATPDGIPSARIVLLRGHGPEGFRFFTNYESRKGRELAMNPRAALLFYWPDRLRQVRVQGRVRKADPAASDAYFGGRPRGSQLGAWASPQSRPLPNRAQLEAAQDRVAAEYEGREVPRPAHWGGFVLQPVLFEFWQGRENRLHDRFVYAREGDGWAVDRLAP